VSNNPSSTTTPISLRLSNAFYALLEKRAEKRGLKVSDYLRARINRELCRSHHKKTTTVLEFEQMEKGRRKR